MHLYFREKDTGRFITHFIVPDNEWELIEKAAKEENLPVEEFIIKALIEALEQRID